MILDYLFEHSDSAYREFNKKLVPTVPEDNIIGVRVPILRKLAKEIYGTDEASIFIRSLPHKYLEENNLHAFLIEEIKDYDACAVALEDFLPYIDNWATCDSLSPKVFKRNKQRLLEKIYLWLKSEHVYTQRFAVCMLMKHFLDGDFDESHPALVASLKTDEYYIKMVVAWYFATALAKQKEIILPYFENMALERETLRMAIKKAIESYRIDAETKRYLKNLSGAL